MVQSEIPTEINAVYPSPESGAGWSVITSENDVERLASVNRSGLDQVFELQEFLYGVRTRGIIDIDRYVLSLVRYDCAKQQAGGNE